MSFKRHSSLETRCCWWRRYLLILLRTHADEGDGTVRESEGGRGRGVKVPQNISGSKALSGSDTKTQQVKEEEEAVQQLSGWTQHRKK